MKSYIVILISILSLSTLAQQAPLINSNKIDGSGRKQGIWDFYDANGPMKVSLRFKNDIPSDTIFYFRNDSLKFTYIKSGRDTFRYIINDGNTFCKNYFTLKDIFYCSEDTALRKKINSYIFYEVFPVFYGGHEAMNEYLTNRMMKVPKGEIGTVKVRFVIDERGKPDEVKITESNNPKLDEYCLRIVREMPAWQAGYQGGKVVRVPLVLPFRFK